MSNKTKMYFCLAAFFVLHMLFTFLFRISLRNEGSEPMFLGFLVYGSPLLAGYGAYYYGSKD